MSLEATFKLSPDELASLAQLALCHLQSAANMHSALLRLPASSAFLSPVATLEATVAQMNGFLTQLSLHFTLPFAHTPTQAQLLDLPTEIIEHICGFLPPRCVLRLRQLSHSFNALLLAPHFAKLNLDNKMPLVPVTSPAAVELDHQFFHWPQNYQSVYLQRAFQHRTSLDWRINLPHSRIPTCIGTLTALIHLDLSYSNLIGTIPVELMNLTTLESLKLHENALEGPLPEQIGNLVYLQVLNVHSNRLSGPIPRALAKCQQLTYLSLGYNVFSGEIPKEIGTLGRLRQLYLNDNCLRGLIPKEFGDLRLMNYLFLQNNGLSGCVPMEMGGLLNLVACDMKGNRGLVERVGGMMF
ncbi:hypothetical protein HDU98_006283 [Podochytrium sp. JEL0797]|nr:hypothetical protein HDU98_006283 [Podochytrium sp. JEL0797]